MENRPRPPQLQAWRAFLTAHARVTEVLERELTSERGLPLAWYDVLVQLSEAPEHRLRMHGLARAVLLSRAGLTRLVDRMVGAGLVARVPCENDRRGTYVTLTPAGMEALRAAAPVHLRGIEEHFARHLPPDQAAVLSDVFARVLGSLGE
ncbi:MAG: MarR family winged helix-turn-helix transcriptional regulator [Hyphomicrobiales bacterium]